MRHAGPAVILLLLLVALLPPAGADHTYSHRYVVFARVVDAEDLPVANVSVSLELPDPIAVEGNCGGQPHNETQHFGRTATRSVSDADGFVIFCRHMHTIDPTLTLTATLRAGNATTSFPLDAELRVDHATLVVPDAGSPGPTAGTVVVGRLWHDAGAAILVDHIAVYGDTLKGENVSVGAARAVTNNYGDFAIAVPTAPASVIVRGASYAVAAEHGWAHVKARVPPDATLVAHVEGGQCWWSTPDAPTIRNPNVTVPAGRSATLLVDPEEARVTLRVGEGALELDDARMLVPLREPPTGSYAYACEPGDIPEGRIAWTTPPPPAATTTTPTTAPAATPAKSTPVPLALAVGALAVSALLLRRKGL